MKTFREYLFAALTILLCVRSAPTAQAGTIDCVGPVIRDRATQSLSMGMSAPKFLEENAHDTILAKLMAIVPSDVKGNRRFCFELLEGALAGRAGGQFSIDRSVDSDSTDGSADPVGEGLHKDPGFWMGVNANGFVTGDHRVGYYFRLGTKYLIFPNLIGEKFSIEPIYNESDLWYLTTKGLSRNSVRYQKQAPTTRVGLLSLFESKLHLNCAQLLKGKPEERRYERIKSADWQDLLLFCRFVPSANSTYTAYLDSRVRSGRSIVVILDDGCRRESCVDKFGTFSRRFNEFAPD